MRKMGPVPEVEKAPWGVKFRSYKAASRKSAMHKIANQAKSSRMDKLKVW